MNGPSLRAKFAGTHALLLALSTLLITLVSQHLVDRELLRQSETATANVHHLVGQFVQAAYDKLQDDRQTALDTRRNELRQLSGLVRTTLEEFRRQVAWGRLTPAQAQQAALELLRKLRFGNHDYFFAYDRELTAIAHPDPSFEGRNLLDYRDPDGRPVLQDIRRIALEEGEGFLVYRWKRLQDEDAREKLGYVFHDVAWDWILGTGVYIDDIEKQMHERLAQMRERLRVILEDVSATSGSAFVILDLAGEPLIAPAASKNALPETVLHALAPDLLLHLPHEANPRPQRIELEVAAPGRGQERWLFHVSRFTPLGWVIVSAQPLAALEAPGDALALRQLLTNGLILLVGLLLASVLVRWMLRPFVTLAEHARALPEHDFVLPVAQQDRLRALRERYRDEAGQLADAFLRLEEALQQHLDSLTRTTAAKERIESELRIAHEIQMGILPKLYPAFPDRQEFDIFATLTPAREVGGDLYDFFFIDEHRFCFVIGDVSGKGVPAAFFMAVTKTLFKAVAEGEQTPGQWLTRVNRDLATDNEACMFVTLFCGVLDTRDGCIDYACAGHNPPLIHGKDSTLRWVDVPHQPAAGAMDGIEYQTCQLLLAQGERLVMYTDGITEAMNATGALYGEARLTSRLAHTPPGDARALALALLEDVHTHEAGAEPADDLTLMVLYYRGPTA
ncbi:MAG: SpoIIE family protein phosphatase [Halothiobacillaceae bacterium]|nr:SpoIIE family protein phosphatase [Halothiobacillaceae bacterium]